MSTTLTIAKREFRSYFDSALAYVVVCLSLFVLGLCVFHGLKNLLPPFWQLDRASLSSLFDAVPAGLVVLIVPVVTMRLLAEEKRSGTLEMLITLPVKDSEVILGKYLGALGLVLSFVAATLAYPILMFKVWALGSLDMWPVISGYLGLVLFSAATVAIGMAISSYTDSQVIAFFVTFFVLVALYMIGDVGVTLFGGGAIGTFFQALSFKEHFQSFPRGLIDTTDIVFFVSFTILPLMLAFRSLESRKWA
jgi:ABC-2 type transport system permease protein